MLQQQRQKMLFSDMLEKVGGGGVRWGTESEEMVAVTEEETDANGNKIPTVEEFRTRFQESVSDCLANAYT